MGRQPVGDRAMTPAERSAAYRRRQKDKAVKPTRREEFFNKLHNLLWWYSQIMPPDEWYSVIHDLEKSTFETVVLPAWRRTPEYIRKQKERTEIDASRADAKANGEKIASLANALRGIL